MWYSDSKPKDSRSGRYYALMVHVQRLAWMVEIWATENFFVNAPGVPVGANHEPVGAFLRERAKKTIPPMERQILELLDVFLKSTDKEITTEDVDSERGSAQIIAIWASLWQLMLTYRRVLQRALPNSSQSRSPSV